MSISINNGTKKLTAKQWAATRARCDLELCTDYYYERHADEWKAMTDKERVAVTQAMAKLDLRIAKLLREAGAK